MGKKESKGVKREEQAMSAVTNQTRPCSISESIIEACKEVKSMREGRSPKRSLSELFANIEKWSKEEEK
ncbi:MAG: hypothetical protein NC123_02445 [Butyrivibrio sp.]|nr:hypothetical protein [Acetatifactor muris]MCM1558400.1 hypothetical protein [Butyrivibrio sp.]